MRAPILTLQNIALSIGGPPLLVNSNLAVNARDRICVVGPNGSGKSTLLKLAAGALQADQGERFIQPGTKIYYLAQEPDAGDARTVFDYVSAGLPLEEHYLARTHIDAVGLTPEADAQALSGGELRRAALARAFACQPDLLLLDEPTNHLDLATITWLEQVVSQCNAAVLFISHDRQFLKNVSRGVVWLHNGATHRLDEGYERFEAWRDARLEEEALAAHKLDRQIAREEDWMRYGVTARRKRNVRRVAELATLRRQRSEILSKQRGSLDFEALTQLSSGKLAVDIRDLSKTFEAKAIVRHLDMKILRGDRVGIIGPNGSGKTTLLQLMTGGLTPDSGVVTLGPSIRATLIDQRRTRLQPNRTLAQTLTDGHGDTVHVNGVARHVIGYMKDFLFRPEQARTPVSALSGGERGRLALALALLKPTNLLVLDEPTNDLDLDTLDVLQEWLDAYKGTVLLVSHDRDFLDRVVTSTLVFEGDGRWTEYAGGYSDMIAVQRLGTPSEVSAPNRPAAKSDIIKPTVRRRKLSYQDQRALDNLPVEMAKLEAQIARNTEILSQGDLFTKDPARFKTITETLAAQQAQLTQAEENWLELELKRSALDDGPAT